MMRAEFDAALTGATQASPATAASATAASATADGEFLELLKWLDDQLESDEERRTRQAREAAEQQRRREYNRKRVALEGLIAQYRSRVAAGGGPEWQAKLSMALTELFWLGSPL